jgi:hypothetical protein
MDLKIKINFKILFEILAAGSIVFSIIWSIQVQIKQDKWQKNVETLHALESRDRSHMRNITSKIKNVQNSDSLINLIGSDSALKHEIREQLITYEGISIGANIGMYDDEVITRFMGRTFINFNQKLKPYILYLRTKNNAPNTYIEYDICVERLTKAVR